MEATPARTSGKDHSIWKPLNENTFRNHILQLCSISKDVPVDPHMHTKEAWQKRSGRAGLEDALIPFTVEKQVADDFAFLAAATEGAHSVSAAAIETVEDPQGLVIRLAANNGVANPVKQALTEMIDSLQLCGSGGKHLRLGHSFFDDAQATGKGFPRENAELRFLMLSLHYTQNEFTVDFDQDTGVGQSTTVQSPNPIFRKNCASGPERMRMQFLLLPVVPGHCWLP
jgi:hypothetical protein